ncbi:hypothetical protein E3J38_01885 [candidate division TA06 bacterium]|uniref:Uncharacterized protein n=1 Tax=candidate division TA06 bacterium TaxID=2250710 RepID=A0A523XTH5_UNCT6|nr:MAG: hypothetical protein E3J38_01885 [candidate division TA06 bacterium]
MATFNFNIIFHDHDKDEVLCFKHAVMAVLNGHDVTPEIDEFGQDGNDMRSWHCEECSRQPIVPLRYGLDVIQHFIRESNKNKKT